MIPAGLLPPNTPWFIAGGYAACPALANDIDVWVCEPVADLEETRVRLLVHLEQFVAARNPGPGFAYLSPYKRWRVAAEQGVSTAPLYDQDHIDIRKVAVVLAPDHAKVKPIHVIVTNAPDAGSILSGFDISTHAVAIDHTGRVWRHNLWTAPHQPPAVIRTNPKTQERLDRICQRFGHASWDLVGEEAVPF